MSSNPNNKTPDTYIQSQAQNLPAPQELNKEWSWDTLIVENNDETIFSLDREWRFAYLNPRAVLTTGRPRETLLGKVIWEEFPFLLGTTFEKVYRESMSENTPGTFEDFSTFTQSWYEVRVFPIVQGLIVYLHNITERKRWEQTSLENETRYKALSENASEGVIIYQSGQIIEASSVSARLYGYNSPVELIGLPFTQLIAPENLPAVLQQQAKHNEEFFEVTGLKKDGSRFPLEGSIKPINYQGQPAWVGIIRDLTERKLADAALKRYNRRLEILHEIDLGLIKANSFAEVIEAAVKNIRELIPCRLVVVTILDQNKGDMVVFSSDANYARPPDQGDRISLPPNWYGLFDGFNLKNIRLIEDLGSLRDIAPKYKQLVEEGLVSALQVLLVSKDKPIGMLALMADTKDFFTSDHYEIAIQVGSQINIALQQLTLVEEIARRSAELEQNVVYLQQAEEEIRKSELRYRSVVEDQTELICRYDSNYKLTFANPAYYQTFGKSTQALLGESFLDRIPLENLERAKEHIKALNWENPVAISEHQGIMADSSVRWYEWTDRAIFKEDGSIAEYQGIGRDITQRKLAEAALQESYVTLELRVLERTAELERVKTRLEAIFNNSGEGIFLLDLDKGIQQTNYAFDQLFKLKPGEANGLLFASLVEPAYLERLYEVIGEVVQSHLAQQIELVAQFGDKIRFEAEINISPVNFTENTITSLVCIVRDVSEHRRAQRMIAEERNLLRTLIDAIPDFIYVKDLQHQMVLNNLAHTHSLKAQTPEQVLGKTDLELFPPELANKYYADEAELLRSGQPLLNSEERSVGQDGSSIWALTTKVPLRNLNGEIIGLVGITHDITRLKQQEEALIHNQANLQSVIECSELAFILLDLESNILVFNHLAKEYNETYFGSTLEIGHSLIESAAPERRALLFENINQIKAGKNVHFVSEIKSEDKILYFEFRYYPVTTEEGMLVGVNIAYEDITRRKETELQLRFLANLQESMSDAVMSTDMQLNIRSWNKAAERMYGWSTEEVLGKSISELRPVYRTENANPDIMGALKEYGYWSGEISHRRKDGSVFYVLISVGMLKDSEGKPIGLVSVNRDISERKLAEEVLQKTKDQLQAILDYSPSSIFMKDLEGRLLLLNQRYANELNIAISEAIGKTEEELYNITNPNKIKLQDQHVVEKGVPLTYEEQLKEAILLRTKFPIFNGAQLVYAIGGISTDITTQKQIETKLEKALQQEKEVNELKSRFISVASHEFRTPLAAILATTETLTIYRAKMTEAQITTRLDKIRDQVHHLKLIMDDVLLLSKMETGHLEFKPVTTDLDAYCKDIIEEFESTPNIQHQIIYSSNPQPLITQVDLKLMRHILNNLLSNALKYSPDGKRVILDVTVEGESCKIRVKDEGIGIPEEDLKHLFEPFYRAGNVGTISGTGLGLSITKQSVEGHGGTIKVKSEVGVGTTFIVTIPLTKN